MSEFGLSDEEVRAVRATNPQIDARLRQREEEKLAAEIELAALKQRMGLADAPVPMADTPTPSQAAQTAEATKTEPSTPEKATGNPTPKTETPAIAVPTSKAATPAKTPSTTKSPAAVPTEAELDALIAQLGDEPAASAKPADKPKVAHEPKLLEAPDEPAAPPVKTEHHHQHKPHSSAGPNEAGDGI